MVLWFNQGQLLTDVCGWESLTQVLCCDQVIAELPSAQQLEHPG